MSPKTGRPTDDPKPFERKIRLSEGDLEKLDFCAETFGITKAEVMRQGIKRMFEEAQKLANK